MKKWWHFVIYPKAAINTVAQWPMPERQPLRNLQICGAFFAVFTSEK
jgi:hypothetical protein